MSLYSKAKSAVKKVASAFSSPKTSSTKTSGTLYSGGKAIGSTVTPGSSMLKGSSVPTSTAKKSSGIAYSSTGKAIGSTVTPGSSLAKGQSLPNYRSSNSSSRGGGSSSSNIAGAYDALKSIYGGGVGSDGAEASDGSPGVNDGGQYMSPYTPNMSSYKGKTGVEMSIYTPGQGQSLEAKAQGYSAPVATPESRSSNRAVIADWDNSAPEREAQIAALQQQIAQLNAARDAVIATPIEAQTDETREALLREEERANREYDAIQREMERLSKPSEEYLAAQAEEQALTEEEMRVKDDLGKSLFGIKGQAIPQGFITGQGARQQDLANVQLDRIAGNKVTLQQRLATEQARRQAALDVVKGNANRLASKADRASERVFDYGQETRKNKRDDEDKIYDRGMAERKFQEDVRQFGLTEARLRQNQNDTSNSPMSAASLRAGEAKLRASVGSDGYVNPTVYKQAFDEWGGTTAEFLSKFPPKNYVNPANTWLPAILRPASSEGGA